MKEYRLERARRARVWIDEALPANYTGNVLQWCVDAVKLHTHLSHEVAVEASVPEGATVRYGLLGVQFLPGMSEALTIEILVDSTNILFETPLVTPPEQVLLGLTQSYVEAIAEVFVVHAPLLLGSGTLSVRWGAHGVIGSSPAFFATLAHVVLQLLAQTNGNNETVTACLTEWLSPKKM